MRLLLSAALLMAASPVMAQDDYEAVAAQAREVDFDRRRPFAGLNEIGALSQEWSVNAFYAVFQGEHPKQTTFWVVRRVMGDRSGAKAVRWADSRTCPAVETVLLAMEKIPPFGLTPSTWALRLRIWGSSLMERGTPSGTAVRAQATTTQPSDLKCREM